MPELHAEFTIASIVEAMLPRFSDRKLGLLIPIQLNADDHGYGKDGNTRERKALGIRKIVWFLFVRPSNYTKVYVWTAPKGSIGVEYDPRYNKNVVWKLECDHDSCWRDAIGSALRDVHYPMMERFKGRKISGVEMNPYRDVHQFNLIDQDPRYVEIITLERLNKSADQHSKEGRDTFIKFQDVEFHQLTQIKTPDKAFMGSTGILLKDSECHKRYMESLKRYYKAKDEVALALE